MFTILIQEKGGEQRRMVFNKPEVTIGRVQGNDIVLPKGNVSKRHARIVLKDGKFIIVDLKSTNGTYVNGRKITSPLVVKDSDKIYIGDFIVGVDESASVDSDGGSLESSATGDRAPASAEVVRARPTEAQPQSPSSVPMGAGVAGLGNLPSLAEDRSPAAAAAPSSVRTLPPRPAPSAPSAPPLRDPVTVPAPPREPPAPLRDMPPLTAPPPDSRPRPPIGRPAGGTMPPPVLQPIPPVAPLADSSLPMMPRADPSAGPAMPAPTQLGTAAPRPEASGPSLGGAGGMAGSSGATTAMAPMSSLPGGSPAQVVPMPVDKKRGQAGSIARRVVGRAVAAPSRRGVHLEPLDAKIVKLLDLQSNILERLRAKLDLDKIPAERLHEEELWQRAERATIDLVEALETSGELPKHVDQDLLIKEVLNEALALGPLEDLLADEQVDEIQIDRRDRVVVGKAGALRGSGKAFSSEEVFEKVVKRLVAEAGATLDDAHPLVDLRMRDGTRLTAAVAPVAARGACLVLKKPVIRTPRLTDLVAQGALSSGMADFLATCIAARRNILVCGGAGSGKTTLAAALAAAAPAGERVVSIEELPEIAIARDEWIQLETRAGTGKDPEIDLGHLLEIALRLAPDRLIVGEVRGREALALAQALCASIDGAVVAMTGEGAAAALGRLALLARLAAPGSDGAVRELAAQAFEIVVHVTRWSDGGLRVLSIEEVVGCTESTFETQALFQFQGGGFVATGTVPRFYAELEARGIPADQAVFR